jgi:4-hydroxyphenylpyruvate dioxygenase
MQHKSAISSMSLGRAWLHDLPKKLDEAAAQNFEGIEVFYEDLEYFTKAFTGGEPTEDNLLIAAREVRRLCDARRLNIIGLQPFIHYEGLLDRKEHAKMIQKLKSWFRIVKALDTNIIQIPSNFLTEGITGDFDVIVSDMLEVAELGLRETPVVKFVYENLCWGTFIDTWEGAWDIVTRVDRPNFGICLDTFNIAGRVWADPSAPDGKNVNADEDLRLSLERLRKTIDVSKVFYVQVVDAERLASPLLPGHSFHVDGQPARMSWSRNARLFPFEELAYLPILCVLKAITEEDGLNYKGWISMELFSRTMIDPKPSTPREHAQRAMESWKKLVPYMGW